MSLRYCSKHGLYGGEICCPQCGGSGEVVTIAICAAIAMEASGRDGETRLDAEHDSAGRRHRTGDSA